MKSNKINILIISVIIISILFYWYDEEYGMDRADTFEVNSYDLQDKLLIATQQSDYKDALVRSIIKKVDSPQLYIKVTDVSNLKNIDADSFNAIVILHTWELWKAPESVVSFIQNNVQNNTFVVGTSSAGDLSIADIDGFSSASVIDHVDDDTETFLDWYNKKLPLMN